MKHRIITRLILVLSLIAAAACEKADFNGGIPGGANIRCRIGGVEETKAYLVDNSNVAEKYPQMVAHVISMAKNAQAFDAETFNSADATTSLTLQNSVWKENRYGFFSYPLGTISPEMENGKLKLSDGKMKFNYTIAKNSTDTPDIIVAGVTAEKSGGIVELKYNHIFTAVNVIYENPGIGHRVTSVKVVDTPTTGTCQCDLDGSIIWSNTGNNDTLVDNATRGITYDGQEITEDGCKFMTIPGNEIRIEVIVDGKTLTKTCGAKKAGDIVNFYIKDNLTVTTTDGVHTGGKVEKNPDGTYKMTLESFITGEFHSETHITSAPTDYILVLDNSSSMTWDIKGKNGKPKRIELLREAASSFIDKIQENATQSKVSHRISIVSFGKPEYPGGSKDACKAYWTPGSSNYLMETPITGSAPGNLTQVIKGWTTDMSSAKAAVQSLDAKGSNTASALGMELAYQLLQSKREGAVPVVIFFTDGKPENWGGASTWYQMGSTNVNKVSTDCSQVTVANETINIALRCKNAGADVFSIGIFSSDAEKCKLYCETVSSNYPNASGVFKSGTTTEDTSARGAKRTDGKNYFFYVNDPDGLNNAFITIQQTIISSHPSINIHEDACMKTIVSEAFTLPDNYNPGNSVTFYTCNQTGYNPSTKQFTFSNTLTPVSGLTLETDLSKKTFTVSGFDYAANFCPTTTVGTMGKKLVIVIDGLNVNPDRQGTGTNETIVYSTGLYNDSEALSLIDPSNMTVDYPSN